MGLQSSSPPPPPQSPFIYTCHHSRASNCNISDSVWPKGWVNLYQVRKPYSSHSHVVVMLIFVPRLLEGKGTIISTQVASKTYQHLRRKGEQTKRWETCKEIPLSPELPHSCTQTLASLDNCPRKELPMRHFLLQLLQSKESSVYRAHCLEQILPCIKAKFLGTVQTEHLGRKNPTTGRAGPVKGQLSPSALFHLLWNKTWQLMAEAMGRGWFLGDGPTERELGLQVRMRREKSGQGAKRQEEEKGRKWEREMHKDRHISPEGKKTVPMEKMPKGTGFSHFQYCKGGQPWNVPNQNKSAIHRDCEPCILQDVLEAQLLPFCLSLAINSVKYSVPHKQSEAAKI